MTSYRLNQLLPLATALQMLDEDAPVPDDLPILGKNAYRLTLDFFRQKRTRFMDLVPEAIGGQYGYRVCPVDIDFFVTVSMGVGTMVPSGADELVHFIEEVDRRLYRAKQSGRNMLVVGGAPGASKPISMRPSAPPRSSRGRAAVEIRIDPSAP